MCEQSDEELSVDVIEPRLKNYTTFLIMCLSFCYTPTARFSFCYSVILHQHRVTMTVAQHHPMDVIELAPEPFMLPLNDALTEEQHKEILTEQERKVITAVVGVFMLSLSNVLLRSSTREF